MNKSKIAFLKNQLGQKGGLEKYTERLLAAFVEKGCETFLLCSKSSGPHHFHQVFFPPGPFPQYIRIEKFDRRVQKWLKRNQTDLVFGMDRNSYQTHLRLGNGIHKAYLAIRGNYEGKVKKWSFSWNPLHKKILQLEKMALENPLLQKVFANSHMVKNQTLQYYDVDPQKIEVIHNGVEWEEKRELFAQWPQAKETLLTELTLPKDCHYFLFVGSGFTRKGLVPLLKGLSLLKKETFRLLIIGKDKHLSVFKKLSKKFGLEKKVLFLGEKKDPYPYYQLADTLVIPSFYDPFANVTIEALAMGLRVISSFTNGGSEILTPENGDVLQNLSDPEEMKSLLEKAMGLPKTLSQALQIRNSVQSLDFSKQLEKITSLTLSG